MSFRIALIALLISSSLVAALGGPPPPVGLIAWQTEEGVALMWEAPATDDPVESYRIYRTTLLNESWSLIGETSNLWFLDAEMTPDHPDINSTLYAVTAVYPGAGESSMSNPSSPIQYPHCFPINIDELAVDPGCFLPLPPFPPPGGGIIQTLAQVEATLPIQWK